MSKKGFLASLILAIVFTLSLGIYTLVAVFNPVHPSKPSETTVALAFRNGEEVEQLKGYTENKNLTFDLAEGVENPLEYNEETKSYITKDVNASVKAIITKNNGDKVNYDITIYHHNDKGVSAEEPYIVASKTHLMDLANALNNTNVEQDKPTFVNLVADIDLAGENWMPIGTVANPVRSINFNGNGYTINNMTITVNGENYKNYISTKTKTVGEGTVKNHGQINIGFFGQIKVKSLINNVKFKGASITVSPELYEILTGPVDINSGYDEFDYMSVGIVAGFAQYSKIDNVEVSGKINGYDCGPYMTGLGGVAGMMAYSQITNANVAVEINNNHPTVGGSTIGGVVGRAYAIYPSGSFTENDLLEYRNLIENVNVSVDAKVVYNNGTLIGGVVSRAENTLIKNVNVTSFKVLDTTAYKDISDSVAISDRTRAGGVAVYFNNYKNIVDSLSNEFLDGYKAEIINVNVYKMDVSALASTVSGLVVFAGSEDWVYGKDAGITLNITDCTVEGSISSRMAIGLVNVAHQDVVISYSDEFTGPAVNVSLKGKMATAGVDTLYGKFIGNANKVKIIAKLYGRNQLISDKTPSVLRTNHRYTYSSGLVGSAEQETASSAKAEIKNFDVQVVANEIVSFAGVSYITKGAIIDNVSVDADVKSYNYSDTEYNYSTAYAIAGAICEAFDSTSISNADVKINVNQNVDKAKKYGFNFFGGIVARIQENNVTVDNCKASGNVYANYAYERIAFEVEGETSEFRSIFLAGGIVGTIQSRGDKTTVIDELLPVDTSNVIITNNTVSDLSIVADFKEASMTKDGYRVKAIGAVVGNAIIKQSAEGEPQIRLNLSTNNVVSNFTVKADKVTFSYATSEPTTTVNTLGVNADGDVIYIFGVANNNMLVDQQSDIDLSTVKFEALEA